MKKIMFNDTYGLTEAVLEGRKIMTRRIMTPQPSWVSGDGHIYNDSKPPRFNVGEVVAVAQSYEDIGLSFIAPPNNRWGCTEDMSGYRNKMFVLADLMPHQIQIIGHHVERMQDISDEDCIREGVFLDETAPTCYQPFYTFPGSIDHNTPVGYKTPREAFADLIRKVSGKRAWDDNPYVDVYEFELVK